MKALEGVCGQRHAPAALLPEKGHCGHCTGGWLGLEAGLGGCGKSLPPIGVRTPDHPARSESLYRLRYAGRNLHTFKLAFTPKKVPFGYQPRLVGINVSDTITLLYHQGRHNGYGNVRNVVLCLQQLRQY